MNLAWSVLALALVGMDDPTPISPHSPSCPFTINGSPADEAVPEALGGHHRNARRVLPDVRCAIAPRFHGRRPEWCVTRGGQVEDEQRRRGARNVADDPQRCDPHLARHFRDLARDLRWCSRHPGRWLRARNFQHGADAVVTTVEGARLARARHDAVRTIGWPFSRSQSRGAAHRDRPRRGRCLECTGSSSK